MGWMLLVMKMGSFGEWHKLTSTADSFSFQDSFFSREVHLSAFKCPMFTVMTGLTI